LTVQDVYNSISKGRTMDSGTVVLALFGAFLFLTAVCFVRLRGLWTQKSILARLLLGFIVFGAGVNALGALGAVVVVLPASSSVV
jgi:hypothetical protein